MNFFVFVQIFGIVVVVGGEGSDRFKQLDSSMLIEQGARGRQLRL